MAEAPDENPSQLGVDAFLGGRLQLRQPLEGHRSGTDAVLLAASAPADFSGLAIDVGAGVGAAGLAMVIARPRMRVQLLENDPSLAGLARENFFIMVCRIASLSPKGICCRLRAGAPQG